jgi:hypothetical protein
MDSERKNLAVFDLDDTLIKGSFREPVSKDMLIPNEVCEKLSKLKEVADLAIVSASNYDINKLLINSGCENVFNYVYNRFELEKLNQDEKKKLRNDQTQIIANEKARTLLSFVEKGYAIEDIYFIDDSIQNIKVAIDEGFGNSILKSSEKPIVNYIDDIEKNVRKKTISEITGSFIPRMKSPRAKSFSSDKVDDIRQTLSFESPTSTLVQYTPSPSGQKGISKFISPLPCTPSPQGRIGISELISPSPISSELEVKTPTMIVSSSGSLDDLDNVMNMLFISPPKILIKSIVENVLEEKKTDEETSNSRGTKRRSENTIDNNRPLKRIKPDPRIEETDEETI